MPEYLPNGGPYPDWDNDSPRDDLIPVWQNMLDWCDRRSVPVFSTEAERNATLVGLGPSDRRMALVGGTVNSLTMWDGSAWVVLVNAGNQAYTEGTFALYAGDTAFSLGSSQRGLWYRTDGARCFGWAYLKIGTGFSPPAGQNWGMALPFPSATHQAGTQNVVAHGMVTQTGSGLGTMIGVGLAVSGNDTFGLYINDPKKGGLASNTGYTTGSTTSSSVWQSGDQIRYNFDYERA